MKLRIHDRSVRLRLAEAEIAHLLAAGRLEEHLPVGPGGAGGLAYGIEVGGTEAPLALEFVGTRLLVRIRRDEAEQLGRSELDGVEGSQPSPAGVPLLILVERDYAA
jgi:hypothetical protein